MRDFQRYKKFVWKGKNKYSENRKGALFAQGRAQAKQYLLDLQITIEVLEEKKQAKSKVTKRDILVFTEQLYAMIKAHLSLAESLKLLALHTENPSLREIILDLKEKVESGESFHFALSAYPKYFDEFYQGFVQTGEQTGQLDLVLDNIVKHLYQSDGIYKKLKSAFLYPSIILVFGVVVNFILLFFVVPQFATIYEQFGKPLPALTQFFVNISYFFIDNWFLSLAFMAFIVFLLRFLYQKEGAFYRFVKKLPSSLPVVSPVLVKGSVAQFTKVLHVASISGLPLVKSLHLARNNCYLEVHKKAVSHVISEVEQGVAIATALEQEVVFPSLLCQMLRIGEKTGRIEEMLERLSDYYAQEVDESISKMIRVLEPLILAVIGLFVGIFIVSMYLPIFDLGTLM